MMAKGLKALLGAGLLCVLVSCSTQRPPQPVDPVPAGGPVSGPVQFKRPNSDGAPWWDVDVSQIPDAVPMPHTGNYKASPYTVMGKRYYPMQDGSNYQAVGTASWYGTKFHGQATANGEAYDLYGMTAAHKTLPLPSYVRVTNLENGLSVVLRVNDRGPFYSDRIIDLSFAAAKKLGFAERGTAPVKVEGIDPERWWAEQSRGVPRLLGSPSGGTAAPVASAPVTQPVVAQAPVIIDSKKKRFCTSLWPVSPARGVRQSGRCRTPEGQADGGGQCPCIHQLSGSRSAGAASGATGTDS